MAQNFMMNVGDNFNIVEFSNRLADVYRAKGFAVNIAPTGNNSSVINFDKGTGGINTLLGLGLGVKANCTYSNGSLMINYFDEEWTGKIVGFVVGWFLCFIPLITAIIGTVQQFSLTGNINNDAMMVINTMNNGQPQYQQANYAQPQQPQQPQNPNEPK